MIQISKPKLQPRFTVTKPYSDTDSELKLNPRLKPYPKFTITKSDSDLDQN